MNISEANDVNTVLRWLTGDLPHVDERNLLDEADLVLQQDDDARRAAQRLADRAHKTLHAGMTPADVEQAWEKVCVG